MIVNNRLEGTRITIWDVLHYLEAGWSRPDIAATFHLTEAQIAAAARYIEEHRDEVMVVHRQIEDRKARGNPPEILAKAAKSRAKLQEWLTTITRRTRRMRREVHGILADAHCAGHLALLLRLFQQNWRQEVWEFLCLAQVSFSDLGLPPDASDREVWEVCQREQVVLLTANRNDEGPESLAFTI